MPKLLISCPSGFDIIRRETNLWLNALAYELGGSKEFGGGGVTFVNPIGSRIHISRNELVNIAVGGGYTHLLMVDPDQDPDRYVGDDPRAVPFFWAAMRFMRANGPCVTAAPTCMSPPECDVNVFGRATNGALARITRNTAANLHGWHRVGAVGTGLMLVDVSIFGKLDKPYFSDVYTSHEQAGLKNSQDVAFCENCHKNNVPVYVCFDAWMGHKKTDMIERPGWNAETQPVEKPQPQTGEYDMYTIADELAAHLEEAIGEYAAEYGEAVNTFECGCGRSTEIFKRLGCKHVALEDEKRYLVPGATYAPLVGDPVWYDWEPEIPYDIVLIDGPANKKGRSGVLRHFRRLVHADTTVFVDDVDRGEERTLAKVLANEFMAACPGYDCVMTQKKCSDTRSYAVLRLEPRHAGKETAPEAAQEAADPQSDG